MKPSGADVDRWLFEQLGDVPDLDEHDPALVSRVISVLLGAQGELVPDQTEHPASSLEGSESPGREVA